MEAGQPQSELIESYCLTHRRKPIQTEAFLELTDGGGGGEGQGEWKQMFHGGDIWSQKTKEEEEEDCPNVRYMSHTGLKVRFQPLLPAVRTLSPSLFLPKAVITFCLIKPSSSPIIFLPPSATYLLFISASLIWFWLLLCCCCCCRCHTSCHISGRVSAEDKNLSFSNSKSWCILVFFTQLHPHMCIHHTKKTFCTRFSVQIHTLMKRPQPAACTNTADKRRGATWWWKCFFNFNYHTSRWGNYSNLNHHILILILCITHPEL